MHHSTVTSSSPPTDRAPRSSPRRALRGRRRVDIAGTHRLHGDGSSRLPSSVFSPGFGRCRGGWRTRVVGRSARRQRGAALAPPADRRPLAAAPLPPALLLWSGRLALLVWVAVAAIVAVSLSIRFRFGGARSPLVAGVLGFAIGLLAFVQVRPSLPAGDEPHYLVITQSLLEDGDLRIENNHRQRDYRSYFAGDLPPDFRVRGRNREIYSIHAPGVSAFVAPAFFVGGYRGVVLFLLLLSAAGARLRGIWRVCSRAGTPRRGLGGRPSPARPPGSFTVSRCFLTVQARWPC